MRKKGKYLSAKHKQFGNILVLLGAAFCILLIGIALFLKKDKPEQTAPTVPQNTPYGMIASMAASDVQWAQATVQKEKEVHLFLTQQQIRDLVEACNKLEESDYVQLPVENTLSVMLHFTDKEIRLHYDGERVGFGVDSSASLNTVGENWSVLSPDLQVIFDPIVRLSNTKQWVNYMTAYDLENLRLQADTVTWEFFEDFVYWDIGSGKRRIPVDSQFYILAEGDQDGRPESMYLVETGNVQNRVDIRNGDIDAFLAAADGRLQEKEATTNAFYSQEQAMIDGCVVMQDGDVRHNQDKWFAFMEEAQGAQSASVTVIQYLREEYGTTYTRYGLSYDGELYTVNISTQEQTSQCVYTNLEAHSEGVDPNTQNRRGYIRYTLTGGRETGDIVIYEDRISHPNLNQTTSIALHLKEGEPPLITFMEDDQAASILQLLRNAEYLEVPPKNYLYGTKLILLDKEEQQTVLEMDLMQGVFRYGMQCYRYGELSDLFRVLGIRQWPEEVRQEFAGYL